MHPNSSSVEERILTLEKENREIKEQLNVLGQSNRELKESFQEYESFYKNWKQVFGFFGIVGMAGLLWLGFKTIPGKVNKEVEGRITTLLTDRREDFMTLLKELDAEQQIKKKHNLVLLTHRNGSDTYHFDMLTRHGFRVSPLTNIERLLEATFSSEDVIIINNEGGHWKAPEIQHFIDQHQNCCFYIGRGIIETSGEAANRFAAANVRTQFIGNLINVLKYR